MQTDARYLNTSLNSSNRCTSQKILMKRTYIIIALVLIGLTGVFLIFNQSPKIKKLEKELYNCEQAVEYYEQKEKNFLKD